MARRGDHDEAGRWLARLHADDRSEADERGFREWLAADPAHAASFQQASGAWEAVGGLRGAVDRAPPARGLHRRAVLAGGAAMVLGGGLLAWRLPARAATYSTEVGEQRRVALDDGSHVLLDTDTRIRVALGERLRLVTFDHGRAAFDVARDARPFRVDAGLAQIESARGRFDLSRRGQGVALIAVEGAASLVRAGGTALRVAPGQRARVGAGAPHLDRPEVDALLAWQQGRAVFRNGSLAEAVAEMNRYSRTPLVLADPGLGALRLSGVFRVGNNADFADSLSAMLPVRAEIGPDRVVLHRTAEKFPAGG